MRHWLLCIVCILCTSCAVEFKSNQFDMIRSAIGGDKRLAPKLQWTVFFEGKQHTAYAIILPDSVRLISLDYLEVEFKRTYVSAIRTLSPSKLEHTISPNQKGYTLELNDESEPLIISCEPLAQSSEYIYIQPCQSVDIGWVYTNELEVNPKREVVYIKTYYSPSKPPLEMYHSPLFEALKK